MKAMTLHRIVDLAKVKNPLLLENRPEPNPDDHEIIIKVSTCGVCHTELDEIEGRTPPPFLPVIPGHQVVGYVRERGKLAERFKLHERVGVAWI